MILYNPSKKSVEFMFGGRVFIMAGGEIRDFPIEVAEHALNRSKVGLVEYSQCYEKEVVRSDIRYEDMPWRNLVSMASGRKIFKPGMPREKVIEALYGSEGRTSQKPFNKEEGEGS